MSNVVSTDRGPAILMGPVMPPMNTEARCMWCRKSVSAETHGPFRDLKSFQEFQMSGFCQECQDDFFGGSA